MIAATDPFAFSTRDGRDVLRGQFDFPPRDQAASRLPLLVVIPGGGFLDRDGQLGNTGSEKDLVFRDLATAATGSGFAVLRWDLRGVSCSGLTMPPCREDLSPVEGMRHYIRSCIDEGARSRVTPENLLSDIEQVFRLGAEHPRVDPSRIVAWAHSEGTLNVARLIRNGSLTPRGVVCAAPIIESPRASQWWLDVGRILDRIIGWDLDGDGRIARREAEARWAEDVLFQELGTPMSELLPPTEVWTLDELRERVDHRYQRLRREALAVPDTAPYALPGPAELPAPVYSSQRWRKQWFYDDTRVVELLAAFPGQIAFHLGAIDSQNPVGRQVELLNRARESFRGGMTLVVHEDRGHCLRSGQPLYGPTDRQARDALVRDAVAMVS